MTEQEIRKQINDCDRQIVSAYNSLRSAARDVGTRGYQVAQSARQSTVSEASRTKTKKILLPLIVSAVGFFMFFGAAWFLGLVMLIGGIVLASILLQKADKELSEVQSRYNSMVSVAESQQANLNSTLDNNTKI